MEIVVLQPSYPSLPTPEAARKCMAWMCRILDSLSPGSQDLIVLPEYANAPGLESGWREFIQEEGDDFIERMIAASRHLSCRLAVGVVTPDGGRWVNRTLLFDSGRLSFSYDKVHLTDAERTELGLDAGYEIPVVECRGVKIGVATCFDLYFAEHFEALAAQGAEVIVCPSYQRSESAARIRLLAQVRALDTGAYLVRSSYAMATPDRGGHSLVAAPDGTLVAEAGSAEGVLRVSVDASRRYVRPASYGRPPVEHRLLIESHRRPALYRLYAERARAVINAPLPYLCAHRGLSATCPENTLPAFGAALALGVHEIELDLWPSRDGVPVVCHDPRVDRTSDGRGAIADLTWAEIATLDAGGWFGERWRGVHMPRFEQVLDMVDGRAVLNIHIKDAGADGRLVRRVCDLIRQRGRADLAYIAGDTVAVLEEAREYAPEIPRACLLHQDDPERQVEAAMRFACRRVQFIRQVTPADVRRARDAGLICNLFWSDEPADARAYVEMGIDVILTNAPHALMAEGPGSRLVIE